MIFFFFSSRRRHTRCGRDWSSDVCSSDLVPLLTAAEVAMNAHEPTDTGDSRMEATAKPRLARGLNALLGDTTATVEGNILKLPVGTIAFNPYQPRKQFDG